jgi:hypothetical protein
MSTENISVGFVRQQHNHSADQTQIVAKQIMNLVTERCTKEVKPIPSIYAEELNKLRDNEWGGTTNGAGRTTNGAGQRMGRDKEWGGTTNGAIPAEK